MNEYLRWISLPININVLYCSRAGSEARNLFMRLWAQFNVVFRQHCKQIRTWLWSLITPPGRPSWYEIRGVKIIFNASLYILKLLWPGNDFFSSIKRHREQCDTYVPSDIYHVTRASLQVLYTGYWRLFIRFSWDTVIPTVILHWILASIQSFFKGYWRPFKHFPGDTGSLQIFFKGHWRPV